MEEVQIDGLGNDNQNQDQVDEEEINRMGFKCVIGWIIWRTIRLIPFIIVNFYFWAQSHDSCDYVLSWFLFVDGIIGSIRLFDPIYFLITKSFDYIFFEKIIYNSITLIWIICGFSYGIVNLSCDRTQYTPTYILFCVSMIMSLVYRLMVCVIPLICVCGCGIREKYKQNKVINFISKLDPLSFMNGSLVDSKGNVVKDLEKEDDKCMICLTDYQDSDEKIIRLNCGHHFHQDCNKEWLKDHSTCPYCKKNVVSV